MSGVRSEEAIAPVGVQLYSLQHAARLDFEATLRRVTEIGYLGVEFDELHGVAPARLRALADELGLTAIGAHAQSPINEAELDQALALGAPTLIDGGGWDEDFVSLEGVRRLAERFNSALPLAQARGMTLGYHNHDGEFASRIDGRTAYDLLMEELDPQIAAEVDIFWVRVGGADPLDVVRSLGERARLLHVKDSLSLDGEAPQSPVGSGSIMDIPAILEANSAVQWHIVELDECATDIFDALKESYRFLTLRGLSRGGVLL
jgi:sugar phosphate isomerase/epimerase